MKNSDEHKFIAARLKEEIRKAVAKEKAQETYQPQWPTKDQITSLTLDELNSSMAILDFSNTFSARRILKRLLHKVKTLERHSNCENDCDTISGLAFIYSEHPDFKEEWVEEDNEMQVL